MSNILVKWDNQTFNLCNRDDLLPPIEDGAIAAWKYDSSWTGKILSIQNSENILIEWFSNNEKNVVSETDLTISNETSKVWWRYDKSWCGTIQKLTSQQPKPRSPQFKKHKSKKCEIPQISSSESDSESSENEECSTAAAEIEGSSESESDNQPLKTFAKSFPRNRLIWKTSDEVIDYPEWLPPQENATYVRTPMEYFEDYFTTSFEKLVCEQSSLYVHQKNPNSQFTLSAQKLRDFVSCCLTMSLFGVGSSKRFWSRGSEIPSITQTMTRNDFESVKKSLHFVDNSL